MEMGFVPKLGNALPGEETGKVLMVQNDETRALNNLQDTELISRQCNKLKVERSS
jgi:hypothetical protein